MEEMFELLLVIVCAVIGIAAKAKKNKKKTESKPASTWDAVGEKISSGIDKLNEILEEEADEDDETPRIVIPHQVIVPAAAQPAAAPVPVMPHEPEGVPSGEGDCDHPLHEPVVIPMPRPAVKPVKESAAIELERIAAHKSSVIPGKVNAAQLRQAVVMSEVLGRPVALKGALRR